MREQRSGRGDGDMRIIEYSDGKWMTEIEEIKAIEETKDSKDAKGSEDSKDSQFSILNSQFYPPYPPYPPYLFTFLRIIKQAIVTDNL